MMQAGFLTRLKRTPPTQAASTLVVALVLAVGASPAQAQEVAIGYQLTTNPWKVAIADQAFEAATGYSIDWRRFDSGAGMVEALGNGEIDIGLAGSAPVAAGLSRQLPIKLFWINEAIDEAEGLAARDGSGIVAPQDLRGKRIAYPYGSTSHFHLLFALEQFGIAPGDVDLKPLEPFEIVSAWQQGQIDAAFIWQPALERLLESGRLLLTSGLLASWGKPTFDGMVARDEFADRNKDFMCRFVQTLGAANAAYVDDPASFGPGTANAAKIARLTGGRSEDVVTGLLRNTFPSLAEQSSETWLGGGAAVTLRATSQFLVAQKVIRWVLTDYRVRVTSEHVDAAMGGCETPSEPADVSMLLDPLWIRSATPAQIEDLLMRGADVNAMSGTFGRSALHFAAGWSPDPAVVSLLLDYGAELEAMEQQGQTALHVAVRRNPNRAVAELLVARGANTEAVDRRGWSVAQSATVGGNEAALPSADPPELQVSAWRLDYSDWIETATVETLANLLDSDSSIAADSGQLASLLHRAARTNEDPAVTALLLDRGADLHATDRENRTVLHTATYNSSSAVARLLLDRSADPKAIDSRGQTPLYRAALLGDAEMVRLLLDRGADPSFKDGDGWTALYLAGFNEDRGVAEALLDAGGTISSQDQIDEALRITVGYNRNPEVAKLLLDRGADPNYIDRFRRPVLHWAARGRDTEMTRLLLDRGADIEARDQFGRTALYALRLSRDPEPMAKLLLERGADPNARDERRSTPLEYLLLSPNREGIAAVAELLVAYGADAEKLDSRFWARSAPGWIATESLERIRRWLDRLQGIEEGVPDPLLFSAVRNPDPAVTELILDRGASADVSDPLGRTALHATARTYSEGSAAIAELLLDRGTELQARDRDGQTALHMAARLGTADLLTILLERGARPDEVDRQGRTALHWAARENVDPDAVRLLLDHGALPNATDHGGATALTLAGLNPNWEVTELLLERGLEESDLEERLLDTEWLSKATDVQIDAQTAGASYGHLQERDECGRTALHLLGHYLARNSVSSGDFRDDYPSRSFNDLLRRIASVETDLGDSGGNTALHYAAAGAAKVRAISRFDPPGRLVISALRSAGADRRALGSGGLWPVHYAAYPFGSGDFSFGGGPAAAYIDPTIARNPIDPLTEEPFPNKRVPTDRFDPCIVSLP